MTYYMLIKIIMSASNLTAFLSLLPFFFFFFKPSRSISCHEIEKQALLSFKRSLQDPSNMLSSWDSGFDCCKWKGVTCSNSTSHVLELHLRSRDFPYRDLIGGINPSLLNLKHLRYLDLSQNYFGQTIPSFLGSLVSLEHLNLSRAGFYGKVPETIGNLSNLRTLILEDIPGSQLAVDSLQWLSGLSKLENLNMNHVNLSKATDWPQVIDKLPSLVQLHFSFCNLKNSKDPAADANVTSNLDTLVLSNNNFQSLAILRWIFQHESLTFLDLSFNSCDGPIPTNTTTIKFQHLDLSFNKFNSTIPDWLYLCKDLKFASFAWNHIQGTISNSIANSTSLDTLNLSYNKLSGKIPREITTLCKMQDLDLSNNKLQGDISDSFGNMSVCFLRTLKSLNLYQNQLSGHLTRQFGDFSSLLFLDLSGNSLSSVIPDSIGNLLSLEYLRLDENKLTGNLPESIGNLLNLTTLSIEDNKLKGVVTRAHFAHLSKLTGFYASQNHLALKVGPDWTPPFEIHVLQLSSWDLGSEGQIPAWLETQRKSILELDLSCTGISGIVPSWVWNVGSINLSHNRLHGEIIGSGTYVYLSSNNFSGPLPSMGDTVAELDLSSNSFSGDLSHFLPNETYRLEILHLGGNQLSGKLPDYWAKLPLLRVLNLCNNSLSGKIPDSVGFLTSLLSLNLNGNRFSGQIPSEAQNWKRLVKMDLSGNNLDGTIPTWIGTSLLGLQFLILRSNKLGGQITQAMCQLTSLQILDLSDNQFSGVIPVCVDNFSAMATKRSSTKESLDYSFFARAFMESTSIVTKEIQLEYDTILSLVTSFDLSGNKLSGDIPRQLTSLVELTSLNLSSNHLTGVIPDGIGNMKQLESLDFSRNSLSGEIPGGFTAMSSLSYLNLSCNNLTGRIPESTQLQGFDESSFGGNSLCGPPLATSCGNDGNAPVEDQDSEEDRWYLYAFVSLGYGVGLSGFMTTLMWLKKSWLEEIWDRVYVFSHIRWRRLSRSWLCSVCKS